MSISVPTLKCVYVTIVELFDVENIVTLKSGLQCTHSLEMVSFESLLRFRIRTP